MGLIFGRKRRSQSRKTSVSASIPFVRWLGPACTAAGVLGLLYMLVTGRIDLSALDSLTNATNSSDTRTGEGLNGAIQSVNLRTLGQKSNETIRLATFNIQIFGKKKASDENEMAVLAKIVSQFDVVAIQEVRGGDATPIQVLVDLLRASGGQYTATVSEPIGRTSQTESYAFVWDESRIQLVGAPYVVDDPSDRMHREPMVASFETRVGFADGRKPFRFTLINVHTSPSEVAANAIGNEMNVLDDVFVSVRNYDYETTGEEDCIMLGDLNVDTKNLRELGQIPNLVSIGADIRTNTRRTKTYDHILIDRTMTGEYTGRHGVLDLQSQFELSEEQALQISDHQPLWAEFSVYEAPIFGQSTASQSNVIR